MYESFQKPWEPKPQYEVRSDSRGHYIVKVTGDKVEQVSGHFSSPKVADSILRSKFIGTKA